MARKRLTKGRIAAIVSVACAAALICALLIINIFWPLKYFTAYFVSRSRPPSDELNMSVLDVGQSDCAIVCLPNGKTMLIDGGDGSYTNNLKILTELNRRDIDYIDYLVCTSVDGEYCGGLGEIIRNKQVGAIFYPYCNNRYITEEFDDFITAAGDSGAELIISQYGTGVDSGEFFFTFLSPASYLSPDSEYSHLNSNPTAANIAAASAVMWIEYAGKGILYAGGVTGEKLTEIAEEYLLMQALGDADGYFNFNGHGIDFSSCVAYKVAAHAAESALATEFTELISPEYSIVSVGENNAEGCPSLAVLADLLAHSAAGSGLFMTMYDGDITLTIDAEGNTAIACSAT